MSRNAADQMVSVLQIECEANAFAKLLAAASRSVTPSSPQGTPQKTSTLSRCTSSPLLTPLLALVGTIAVSTSPILR